MNNVSITEEHERKGSWPVGPRRHGLQREEGIWVASSDAWASDVLPAVGAQDVVPLGEEAAAHQRQRALPAVEAVTVPLPLLEGDVLGASKSW